MSNALDVASLMLTSSKTLDPELRKKAWETAKRAFDLEVSRAERLAGTSNPFLRFIKGLFYETVDYFKNMTAQRLASLGTSLLGITVGIVQLIAGGFNIAQYIGYEGVRYLTGA
jgi:hypothetical protein